MKKGIFQLLILGILFSVSTFAQDELTAEIEEKPNTELAEIKAINFRQVGEISELEVVLDSNKVPAKKFAVVEDKQIILDVKGAQATERVMRAFDTSEFSGSVVFVSAYPRPGSKDDTRIALQLRDNVRSILKRKANRIVLEVENRFGVFDQRDMAEAKSFEEKTSEVETNVGRLLVPKSDSVEDILENLTLSGRKKYIGKRISLNVKDLQVEEILKIIAEASGFKPEECMVIEDSTNGIQAANDAGIYCVGFDSFHSKNQDYTKANKVITDFKEIYFDRVSAILN